MNPIETSSVSRRVTLRDVARAADVHVGTVSKALSGTGTMPAATRARIRALAKKLGYVPDPMLRALAAYRNSLRPERYHGNVAWLLIDQHRDGRLAAPLATLREYTASAAQKLGYRLEEFHLADMQPGRLEKALRARGIEGILAPPLSRPGQPLEMDVSGFAAVALGSSLTSPLLNRVQPHQYLNVRRLVQELRRRGFRRIGFCLPRRIDDRVQGAYSAGFWIEQQDMPAGERIPLCRPAEDDDGAAFCKWFRTHRPDHLIGVPGLLNHWISAAGLTSVPISYFGSPRLGYLPEEMHGGLLMDENWLTICERAVQMLDGMLRHGERGAPASPQIVLIPGAFDFTGVQGRSHREDRP